MKVETKKEEKIMKVLVPKPTPIEFMGYKALIKRDKLLSPLLWAKWNPGIVPNIGVHPVMRANPGDIENGKGVFAAAYREAKRFGDDIYLVAPLPDEDGNTEIVVGDDGWRASAAFVVGGPYSDPRIPAKMIISAWEKGYRQVPGILIEAAAMVGRWDIVISLLAEASKKTRRFVASMEIDPGVAEILARDTDADVRAMLAYNPAIKVAPGAISILARDPDAEVRRALAWNSAIEASPEAILLLARDTDTEVRFELAGNTVIEVAPEAIAELARDPDADVRYRLLTQQPKRCRIYVRTMLANNEAISRLQE